MGKKASITSTIANAWKRIELWLRNNAPATMQLPTGASDDEIRRAEQEIGVTLPLEVRSSYSIHDGTNRLWISKNGYLMPLFKPEHLPKRQRGKYSTVVESWQFMTKMLTQGQFKDPGFRSHPQGPIKSDWWNPHWVPLTFNECGDHLCCDLNPDKGGVSGQIIDWWNEKGATAVVSITFADWLGTQANMFEHGEFVYDETTGLIVCLS